MIVLKNQAKGHMGGTVLVPLGWSGSALETLVGILNHEPCVESGDRACQPSQLHTSHDFGEVLVCLGSLVERVVATIGQDVHLGKRRINGLLIERAVCGFSSQGPSGTVVHAVATALCTG